MKNFKKIILSSQILLSSIGPAAGSATFYAVNASSESKPVIEMTDPLEDLKQNDEFRYLYNLGHYEKNEKEVTDSSALVPMNFTEWHWGYSDYALYFYVWNGPHYSGFDLLNSLNGVTLQNVDSGSYDFYHIQLVGQTEDEFYKFKILINGLSYATFTDSVNNRTYSLGQLHLKDTESLSGLANAYSFGKKYTYIGNVSTGLQMEQEDLEVLDVNTIGGTYYTTDSDSGDLKIGTFAHNALHYVYFNIPNSMLQQYGDVAEYHFTYHPIPLKTILLIAGSELSDHEISSAESPNIEDLGGERSGFYEKYQWLSSRNKLNYKATWNQYGFHCMRPGLDQDLFDFVEFMRVVTAFGQVLAVAQLGLNIKNDVIAGVLSGVMAGVTLIQKNEINDNYIDLNKIKAIRVDSPDTSLTSLDMDELINLNNLSDWAEIPEGMTWEEYWESAKVEEHLRYDAPSYELRSYDRTHHSVAENNLRNGYELEDGKDEIIKPIEKINSISVVANDDVEKWKIEKNATKITQFRNNYSTAISSGKTPYIFRFRPGIVYSDPLYWTQVGHDGDQYATRWKVKRADRAGTVFKGEGIYDLVSLDLTFAKDGVETIIPICANPTNINPSIPAAPDEKTSEWSQSWNQFLNIMKKVLTIVAIVLCAVLAIYLLIKLIGFLRRNLASGNK